MGPRCYTCLLENISRTSEATKKETGCVRKLLSADLIDGGALFVHLDSKKSSGPSILSDAKNRRRGVHSLILVDKLFQYLALALIRILVRRSILDFVMFILMP